MPSWRVRARRFFGHALFRRFVASVFVLLGVTFLTFWVMNVLPGGTARLLLGAEATSEQVAQLEAELNLDRSPWLRYWDWLSGAVTGDLGRSLANGLPVTTLIGERLPVTLQLVAYAFSLSMLVAIPLALLAARKPDGIVDRLSMLFSMSALSTANYVLALLLVFVFSVQLGILPSMGFTPFAEDPVGNLRSVTLPAIAIALPLCGFYMRFLRGDLLEQLNGQDYVTTAAAKGLGPWRILLHHVLRNSLLGLLTIVALNFGALVGGTVIVEQIFALPGIGQLLLQAISTRDIIVVQSLAVFFAVIVMVANALADVFYSVLDPRIRRDG